MYKLSIDNFQTFLSEGNSVAKATNGFVFSRFNKDNMNYWHNFKDGDSNEMLLTRAKCSASIKLSFITNSTFIELSTELIEGIRNCGSFDLWIDDLFYDSWGGETPEQYIKKRIYVNPNKKDCNVDIYFPHNQIPIIEYLAIDKNAKIKQMKQKDILLAYGDSITQGMDCVHASQTYINVLGRELNMDINNQAVGGWKFVAESLATKPVENPKIITVAFGTNDWSGGFDVQNAKKYLGKIRNFYPKTPLFVLSPIYRCKNNTFKLDKNISGITLVNYRLELSKIVEEFGTHIGVEKLLPPVAELFTDGVHPTSYGHCIYGKNLSLIIKNNII